MATKIEIPNTSSEEILFQNDRVSLCLLVNRRARTVRVIDFRSGPSPAKRIFVMSLAQREGLDRVYTLVEREEVSSWSRLGFQKEGAIPSFYKRSDAYVLGALVPRGPHNPDESGERRAYVDYSTLVNSGPAATHYQAARKLAKERADRPRPQVRVQAARPADVDRAVSAAERNGRALTELTPFGRDVERLDFTCTARGGFSLLVSVESQPCYSNGFIELLTAPRTEKEALLTTRAIGNVCDKLEELDLVSCFALTAIDDHVLGAAFVANAFRRTGLLQGHLLVDGERKDAFLWSRKLRNPEGPTGREQTF